MDLVQNLLIKIKKLSMDLVHDRGSMDPVNESGPWTPGPCFVLTQLYMYVMDEAKCKVTQTR